MGSATGLRMPTVLGCPVPPFSSEGRNASLQGKCKSGSGLFLTRVRVSIDKHGSQAAFLVVRAGFLGDQGQGREESEPSQSFWYWLI